MPEHRSQHHRATDEDRSSTLQYGDRLGRYVITGFAGEGATSYVYRARRQDSFDSVAIKVLHPDLVADAEKRRKFYEEARLMLRMDHRNVVRFHEILETDGLVAFVMEYIEGQTLDKWLQNRRGQLGEQTLAAIFIDVLRGVAHAHEHGVIHRDLKPSNIMLGTDGDRRTAKILDFGVGRFADEKPHRSERDKIIGTAAYISPEEVRDPEAVCPSSDLYSLGVILYEAACGRRPFGGDDPKRLLSAHARREPPSPRRFNRRLSPAFAELIMKTLRKEPSGRFESAGEMIGALERSIRRMATRREATPSVEEMAETTEWTRSDRRRRDDGPRSTDDEGSDPRNAEAPDEDDDVPVVLAYLQFVLAALASTGHTGRDDDPHHLARPEPLYLEN